MVMKSDLVHLMCPVEGRREPGKGSSLSSVFSLFVSTTYSFTSKGGRRVLIIRFLKKTAIATGKFSFDISGKKLEFVF